MRKRQLVVGLGSNEGDRQAHLAWAQEQLARQFGDLEVAGLYRSRPVSDIAQGDFLNTVVIATCRVPQEEAARDAQLLAWLTLFKTWEGRAGRRRGPRFGPRPLDVDLLLCGDLQCQVAGPGDTSAAEGGVILPHPRLQERRFVLAPLADLRPQLQLPDGLSVAELLAAIGEQQEVERLPSVH